MIYNGKEYAEVTGEIGDLIHVTEVEGEVCDVWGFTTDSAFTMPDLDVILPNGWETLDDDTDEWTRYRYVKDVEETPEVLGKSPSNLAGKAMEAFSKGIVRAWVKPSEANVKEGDYMVITDNGYEGLAVGTLVKVLEPVGGDNDFWAENDEFLLYIDYADARFATTDEIAALNKPQLTFDRGDHVKILSDIAEGHADFSLDSVVTAQFRTDEGVMVQNLKGDVRKVIADEFLRKATPDEAIAAISARYGHGERTLKTQIDDFYDGMSALLVAKNENYGDSFSKQYDKYGMQGVEMRLNDKFMRLEQLIAGQPDKVGESVEDTLKDIIGYSTLALLKINENRTELSA